MSLAFLLRLNGNRTGRFARWIGRRSAAPRILWYPSSGWDLRDVLYLHPEYIRRRHPDAELPAPPDIFLHTDVTARSDRPPVNGTVLHRDARTTITVQSSEELPRLDVPILSALTRWDREENANRIWFIEARVESNMLGELIVPLILANTENAAFCAKVMVPTGARISHLCTRLYGNCMGGAVHSSRWLDYVAPRLGVQVRLDHDWPHAREREDEWELFEILPELAPIGLRHERHHWFEYHHHSRGGPRHTNGWTAFWVTPYGAARATLARLSKEFDLQIED